MALLSSSYTVLSLQFTLIFIQLKSQAATNIAEISLESIEDHITNKQWTRPLCILFLDKAQNMTSSVSKLNNSLEKIADRAKKIEQDLLKLWNLPQFTNWEVGKFYFQEKSLPQLLIPASNNLVRCYIGTSSSHDFDPTMTLKRWMWQLKMVFSERIEAHLDTDLNRVFQTDLDSQFFIIAVPGSTFFGAVESSLFKVRKVCQRCKILVVPPESPFERILTDNSPSQTLPIIMIYHREKERIMPRLKEVLQGLHSSQKEHLLMRILILRSRANVFTLDNFESALMLVRRSKEPLVICFYSSSNPESYTALHAFERSMQYYKRNIFNDPNIRLRFGLIDLAVADNARIIPRYLDALDLKKIPFMAIFWGDHSASAGYTADKLNQRIINDMVPTPWNIHLVLNELHLIPDEQTNNVKMHVCSPNRTRDTCLIDEKPVVYFGPEFNRAFIAKKKRRKAKPLMKTLLDIPLVTDKLWHLVIENTLPMKQSVFGQSSNFMQPSAVKLVIFIMADCGYCEKMMPSFSNLTKSARRLYRTSVYLMNCTSDPVQCKRNGVTGYPTLALFRSVSEEESKHCLLPNSVSSSVRLDYHGNMLVNDILSWLSRASMSAVNLTLEGNKLGNLNKDVRLVAYVYTKKLASKYLSRWLQQKLIPFQCFKLACEKLFGAVECFAKPSMDVVNEANWKGKIVESDLTLDQVTFERRDGASTTIFKLSYPMENTIERSHDTVLHRFHNKHRYSIPNGFRCEDNHPLCTDILVKFVEDHQRLPVTHITRESFHIHGTSASIFSKEFPVLLALVHANNISRNSSFSMELDKVAQSLYTKLIVATLNVDEFPSWASQFVPRDYHYTHHESLDRIPALYHYPRFCIIEWDDHQHAAFYPPVDELEQSKDVGQSLSSITANNIINFSESYFHSKDQIILETEMF